MVKESVIMEIKCFQTSKGVNCFLYSVTNKMFAPAQQLQNGTSEFCSVPQGTQLHRPLG